MKINRINNQEYSKFNTLKTNAPNFKALYFATPEIQQKVCGSMKFSELLQRGPIKKAIKNHNLIITELLEHRPFPYIKKYWHDFKFRTCSDIIQDKDGIKAAVFKGPEMTTGGLREFCWENWKLDSYESYDHFVNREIEKRSSSLMDKKPYFDLLHFRNEEVKEDFQNNDLIIDFLDNPYIQDAISRYEVVILDGKPLKFVACTDVAVDKNNEIKPTGFTTATFTRKNTRIAKECYKDGWLGAHLDTLLESTGAEPSRINKVNIATKINQSNSDDWDSIEE